MFELLVSGGLLLLLDQWSKVMVQSPALQPRASAGGVFQIRYVTHRNRFYERAGARGIFVLLWFAAFASAMLLHRSGTWFQSSLATIGLGCALGGAAGNLLDILRRHHVVDFIDLGCWPIFNLADIGIVGGLILAWWR